MLRKPAILLSSCAVYPKRCCSHHSCSNDASDQSLRKRSKLSNWQAWHHAHTQSDSHLLGDDKDFPWPRHSSAATSPTPYEILQLKKGDPYSKKCFYELVKIYHPDRQAHRKFLNSGGPSQVVKLERYRLIVAANDLLSDPVKRSAYDRCGAGWDGLKESYNWYPGKPKNSRWSGFEDNESVFRNATWEDWEKWHQRNSRPRPEPIYLENKSFFIFVAFVTALATVSQFSKAGQASQTFLDQVGARHDVSSKNLHESRSGHNGRFPNKDQRIWKFLHCREQHGPGDTGAGEDMTSSTTLRTETQHF